MKRFLTVILFISAAQWCDGQTPAPFRQFYFNPYLFNPGYTGINGYTEVYLVYRKQWMNFKDAPSTMGVNFQYPTKKRVSLGASIVSDENVGVRNTSFTGTFAYAVPIASNQALRFGISGGVGTNSLQLKEGEYDPNDTRIQAAIQNSFYVDGNFGALYTNRGLRIGFALPNLFNSNSISETSFSKLEFSPLDNRLYSISYRFPVGTNGAIALEPYFLYREAPASLNSWEAASTVYFREKVWVGASYHETQGLGFFAGVNVKDLLRFSYSYELPPPDNNFIASSSHELHIGLRLGKKPEEPLITKSSRKNIPQIDSASIAKRTDEPVEEKTDEMPTETLSGETTTAKTQENTVPANNTPVTETKPKTTSGSQLPGRGTPQTTPTSSLPYDTQVASSTHQAKTDSVKIVDPATTSKKVSKPAKSFSLANGHYVVAGAFKIMDNAIRYSQELHSKGYTDATIAINPKNNLYYVYIFSSYDIEEARKVRNQYRVRRPFHEVWLFTME
jgi:type IX secretion system PorP/SprF family membrane protein